MHLGQPEAQHLAQNSRHVFIELQNLAFMITKNAKMYS